MRPKYGCEAGEDRGIYLCFKIFGSNKEGIKI